MDEQLHEYELALLSHLKTCSTIEQLIEKSGLEHIKVMRGLQWLSNKGIVTLTYEKKTLIDLDENGILNKERGLPERRFLNALSDGKEHSMHDLIKAGLDQQEIGVSIGALKAKHAINVKNDKGMMHFSITAEGKKILAAPSVEEQFLQQHFPLEEEKLSREQRMVFDALKIRKKILKIEVKQIPVFALTKKGEVSLKSLLHQEIALSRLTPEMLKEGSWTGKKFRHYDVSVKVPHLYGGRRHPLREVMRMIRDIFIEMGFEEMHGPWVETAFWCLDSMWIPQDHPAREVQDTFYLPYKGKLPDKKLVDAVKNVQETGGKTGSKGYGSQWDPEIASQLLMRTHTTATTYRYFGLHGVAKKERAKYFCIGRVFRNEAIDATHLPEFHQVEGFVMDDNLSLKDLMGFIKAFYGKMGLHKIKFKLTYNPYTESSLEAFYYDEKKGKWLELINSGVFRPESVAPYGIKKPVVAWGLGVERLAMTLYKLGKLSDLIGPGCDLNWLRSYELKMRDD